VTDADVTLMLATVTAADGTPMSRLLE